MIISKGRKLYFLIALSTSSLEYLDYERSMSALSNSHLKAELTALKRAFDESGAKAADTHKVVNVPAT